MKASLALPPVLLAVSACVPAPTGTPAEGADTCGAARFAPYVGQDAAVLDGQQTTGPARVIHPGDAVTMDFRSDRINFVIDDTDRIERIYCG